MYNASWIKKVKPRGKKVLEGFMAFLLPANNTLHFNKIIIYYVAV